MLNDNKKICLVISFILYLFYSTHVNSAEYKFDSFTINWDSSISAGTQFRIEERNDRISKGSSGGAGDTSLNNLPAIIDNAFILNSNDGNNSFNKGDMTALRISFLTEADINFGDWGVFIRGKMWQDQVYRGSNSMSDEAWISSNTNPIYGDNGGYNAQQGEFNPAAVDYYGNGTALLDAFWYGSIPIMNDREMSLRIGKQVISWGEALLSGGGLTTAINHVDADIRNQPGFDLKELFLPTNAIFIQTGITDTINFEAYYQLEWNPVILPTSGSYWSEFDSIGAGGETFMFLTGTEESILGVDIGPQQTLRDSGFTSGTLLPNGLPNPDGDESSHPLWDYDADTLLSYLPTNCRPGDDKNSRCRGLVPYKVQTNEASDNGQFGLAFNFFLESGAEAGFYYVNYHAKIPGFELPVDAIDEMAPILEILMNGAAIVEHYDKSTGDTTADRILDAIVKAQSMEYTTFKGINDLGDNLSARQITSMLMFLGVLPEESATMSQITENVIKNPGLLGLDAASGITSESGIIIDLLTTWLVNEGLDSFLKYGFPKKGWSGNTRIKSINYRINYIEDIHMLGATYSTVIGNANVATELSYQPNTPLMRGDVARTTDREQLINWHINTLMVFEPTFLWDFSSFTAEALIWYVPGRKAYDVNDITNPDRLAVQNTPYGLGASMFWTWEYSNVFTGWDLFIPWYVNWGVEGAMFNSGYRDGQVTFATGATFRHLSGFEAGVGLMTMFGDQDDIFQMLLQDRDSVSFTMKYAF
ncbi:MAG: DUF1302 family protein [Pseudomonadales bacterium]|nr:DUF1302 family protein [Pseudomonadales bacterium]